LDQFAEPWAGAILVRRVQIAYCWTVSLIA
jgi:hypothetical protein